MVAPIPPPTTGPAIPRRSSIFSLCLRPLQSIGRSLSSDGAYREPACGSRHRVYPRRSVDQRTLSPKCHVVMPATGLFRSAGKPGSIEGPVSASGTALHVVEDRIAGGCSGELPSDEALVGILYTEVDGTGETA